MLIPCLWKNLCGARVNVGNAKPLPLALGGQARLSKTKHKFIADQRCQIRRAGAAPGAAGVI